MIEFWKNLKLCYKYVKEDKNKLILYIIFNIISIFISIILPILSAKIIVYLTSNLLNQIIILALVILVVRIIKNIVNSLTRKLSISIYINSIVKIEKELGSSILKIENKCLDNNSSGLFIERLNEDTTNMADIFNGTLEMLSNVIEYIGILGAIFYINKYVFIYVIIYILVLYFLNNKRTKARSENRKVYLKAKEGVTTFTGELCRGAKDIKMLNSEKDFLKELNNKLDDSNKKRLHYRNVDIWYKFNIWNIIDTGSIILIILLVFFMKKELITATLALVIYNYCSNIENSIYFIGNLLEYIKDFNLSAKRVFEIIYGDTFKKETFGDKHLNKVKGDFEFKNVEFSYNGVNKVLKDVNFKINANETVAFVGKSGAGKTTIFSLLCKMYDNYKGNILIDNVNIKDLDKDSIRGNITIISQNPYIFNMSIKDNLRLVKENLTESEMKKACKMALLDDFIESLPDKYDTIVGEGGVTLSGGQKQRLAIARALVQKTEIILFDEATSALDNETQEEITKAINNMKNKYTILIIAHRLSTIKDADRILFLDKGKITCEGNHEYLMKHSKEYKNLYKSEISKK